MSSTESANVKSLKKGLDGVVVGNTAISHVDPETSQLLYRGYPAQQLAERCSFEEVIYLLWHGELPTKAELEAFSHAEQHQRLLSENLEELIRSFPVTAHPIDCLRTAVSYLGLEELPATSTDETALRRLSLAVVAKLPVIIATIQCTRKAQELPAPDIDLGIVDNFLQMYFGKLPAKEIANVFSGSLIIYADHLFNPSTFAARLTTSTNADLFSAVCAAICTLKGPLHGGAREEALRMLIELNDPKEAEQWVLNTLAEKKRVMGFGHRLYEKGDVRVPTLNFYRKRVAKLTANEKWIEISSVIENTMLKEKGLHPNIDFPASVLYHMIGFEADMLTPLFAFSRIGGWCAHIIEQTQNNRLMHPLSHYVGQGLREVVRIEDR